MKLIIERICWPAIFLLLSRFLNSRANYYINVSEWERNRQWRINQKKKPTKYLQLKGSRFVLISFFCQERKVAVKVFVMAIIELVNTIFMIVGSLISHYLNIEFFEDCARLLGIVIVVIVLGFANFNDQMVWTRWGTKK